MRGKRRRLWEGLKTLAIVLLACSAVYLAGRTLFPQDPRGFLSRLPQADPTPSAGSQSAFLAQTLRPAAFAVTWEEGRYAVLYHQEDQEVYTRFSALLAEALSGAAQPQAVSGRDWETALRQPGIFCEYLGPLPLDALARWLSNQDNPTLAGYSAQRLCATGGQLYFYNVSDGLLYACALDANQSGPLADLAADLSPNGARFAMEDDRYAALRRDSLVLSTTPAMPQLLAQAPFQVSGGVPDETLSELLQILSFHPQTNPLYAITGGWAITDGSETLRIRASGHITYRRSDDGEPRYPVGSSPLDATRALAEKTVGSLCGDGHLYLQSVRQEGSATLITYGCAYRGAPIQLGSDGWCAQFTVEDGAVSSFVLQPRRYAVAEGDHQLLLPQEQAAAALNPPRGKTLSILYEDGGGEQTMTPFWAVWTQGR